MNSKRLAYLRLVAHIVALIAMLLAIAAPVVLAQSAGTAGLTGTVTDPSGAAVPNVTVTLTSNDTNQARTATTGGDGQYKFTLLPPGSYKVRFAANGFKTAEVSAGQFECDGIAGAGSQTGSRRPERIGHRRSLGRNLANGQFHARNHRRQQSRHRTASGQPQLHPDHRTFGRRQRGRK